MRYALKRWQITWMLFVLVIFLLGQLLLHKLGARIVTAAYFGRSFTLLNHAVACHRAYQPLVRNLAFYLRAIQRLRRLWSLVAAVSVITIISLPARRKFYAFLLTPDAASNLAITRITASFVTLITTCHYAPIVFHMSYAPQSVRVTPPGLGWLYHLVPFVPVTSIFICTLLLTSCFLSIIGVFTRCSTTIAVLSAIWFDGALFSFTVERHILHILVAALALAAGSPSGDELALELKWRRPTLDTSKRHSEYGLPLRMLWIIIGLSYFFPGVWKLGQAGNGYIFGSYMRTILLTSEPSWLHLVKYPILCRSLGWGAITWELSFIFALFNKRLRVFAACCGLIFHLIVFCIMRIPFFPLMAIYVCLIDWDGLMNGTNRLRSESAVLAVDVWKSSRLRLTWVIGSIFVVGYVITGTLGFQTFPISCYPTFSWGYETTEHVDTAFMLVDANGRIMAWPDGKLRAVFTDYYWDNILTHISSDLELNHSSQWANAMLEYWYSLVPPPGGTRHIQVIQIVTELDPQLKKAHQPRHIVICRWISHRGCLPGNVMSQEKYDFNMKP